MTVEQIEFIDHFTKRGVMYPRRLYESPFPDIANQGVSGLFPGANVKALIEVLVACARKRGTENEGYFACLGSSPMIFYPQYQ